MSLISRCGLAATLLPALGLILSSTATAQSPELVTNGGFELGLQGWTQTGLAIDPGVESRDTSGTQVSPAFAVNPLVAMFGFGGFQIAQDIRVTAGRRYSFRADVSYTAPNQQVTDVRTGLLTVQTNSEILMQKNFGTMLGFQVERDVLCGTFVATQTGPMALKITIHKVTTFTAITARLHLDNVSVRETIGPVPFVRGNRRIGDTPQLQVHGEPGRLYAAFRGDAQLPVPFSVSAFAGLLEVNGDVPMAIGFLPGSGVDSLPLPIPNLPGLRGREFALQAFDAEARTGTNLRFGISQMFGVQR